MDLERGPGTAPTSLGAGARSTRNLDTYELPADTAPQAPSDSSNALIPGKGSAKRGFRSRSANIVAHAQRRLAQSATVDASAESNMRPPCRQRNAFPTNLSDIKRYEAFADGDEPLDAFLEDRLRAHRAANAQRPPSRGGLPGRVKSARIRPTYPSLLDSQHNVAGDPNFVPFQRNASLASGSTTHSRAEPSPRSDDEDSGEESDGFGAIRPTYNVQINISQSASASVLPSGGKSLRHQPRDQFLADTSKPASGRPPMPQPQGSSSVADTDTITMDDLRSETSHQAEHASMDDSATASSATTATKAPPKHNGFPPPPLTVAPSTVSTSAASVNSTAGHNPPSGAVLSGTEDSPKARSGRTRATSTYSNSTVPSTPKRADTRNSTGFGSASSTASREGDGADLRSPSHSAGSLVYDTTLTSGSNSVPALSSRPSPSSSPYSSLPAGEPTGPPGITIPSPGSPTADSRTGASSTPKPSTRSTSNTTPSSKGAGASKRRRPGAAKGGRKGHAGRDGETDSPSGGRSSHRSAQARGDSPFDRPGGGSTPSNAAARHHVARIGSGGLLPADPASRGLIAQVDAELLQWEQSMRRAEPGESQGGRGGGARGAGAGSVSLDARPPQLRGGDLSYGSGSGEEGEEESSMAEHFKASPVKRDRQRRRTLDGRTTMAARAEGAKMPSRSPRGGSGLALGSGAGPITVKPDHQWGSRQEARLGRAPEGLHVVVPGRRPSRIQVHGSKNSVDSPILQGFDGLHDGLNSPIVRPRGASDAEWMGSGLGGPLSGRGRASSYIPSSMGDMASPTTTSSMTASEAPSIRLRSAIYHSPTSDQWESGEERQLSVMHLDSMGSVTSAGAGTPTFRGHHRFTPSAGMAEPVAMVALQLPGANGQTRLHPGNRTSMRHGGGEPSSLMMGVGGSAHGASMDDTAFVIPAASARVTGPSGRGRDHPPSLSRTPDVDTPTFDKLRGGTDDADAGAAAANRQKRRQRHKSARRRRKDRDKDKDKDKEGGRTRDRGNSHAGSGLGAAGDEANSSARGGLTQVDPRPRGLTLPVLGSGATTMRPPTADRVHPVFLSAQERAETFGTGQGSGGSGNGSFRPTGAGAGGVDAMRANLTTAPTQAPGVHGLGHRASSRLTSYHTHSSGALPFSSSLSQDFLDLFAKSITSPKH